MQENQPPPDPARIQLIINRTKEIIPVLLLNTFGQQQADQFLTDESEARTGTVTRLHDLLLPYEASLHGQLSDILNHAEDILLRKGNAVQFAIPGEEDGYLTFINVETQKPRIGKNYYLFCKDVTFCVSPTDAVKKLQQEFLSLKFSKNLNRMDYNLPDVYTNVVSFNFNKRGAVSYIATKEATSPLSDLDVYFLDRNDFTVKRGFHGNKTSSTTLVDVAYILCVDGKFRRAQKTSGANASSIEEEIAAVLARLPFVDYQLHKT